MTPESRLENGIQCLTGFLSPRIQVPGAMSLPVRSLAVKKWPCWGDGTHGSGVRVRSPSCPAPSYQVLLGGEPSR